MKKITITFSLLALVAGFVGCQKDGIDTDTSFLNSATPGATGKVFDISNDNSGKVTITPTGEGISSFVVKFGHGTGSAAEATVKPGYSAVHNYPEGSYTVTINSKSLSGQETSATYPLQLTYRAPEKLTITTTPAGLTLKVSATALYAASYLVYFGDVANEAGTPLAKGANVSHTYATNGTYTVKVVALSGGAAKTEAEKTVTVTDPFTLPITFESPTVNYFFGTFGGGQQFAKVANPDASGLNTSAKVGKFTRGWEWWSGTYSPLDIPLDMSQGKKIKVLVYNPDPALVGAKLNVELESGSSINNGVAVLKVPITTSGAWEELVFDFSTISGIPANEKFSQLVLRFNDAADGAAGVGQVIYVDNFRQTN
jgi:PKD repeat protein